jgi:hypothetical protein
MLRILIGVGLLAACAGPGLAQSYSASYGQRDRFTVARENKRPLWIPRVSRSTVRGFAIGLRV